MSTLKKVLALTLALAMVLSLNVFAAFKDQDQINADCVDAVQLMNDLGIMTGDNGNAKPLATITRAEAAAMIFRLMTGKTDASMYNGGKYFTDVVTNSWYDGYVNYCYTMGIIQGKTPTTFDPNAPVTGYEIAKMLLVCCGYKSDKQGYTGGLWAANVQNDAFNAGMLDNYGMSMTAPAQRQWVAVMFMDALNVNMVKYQLGELTDLTTNPETTLGGKKFALSSAKGYLMGVGNISLDTAYTPDSDAPTAYSYVVGTGDVTIGKVKFAADSSLLGCKVKVTYKKASDGSIAKVYGISSSGTSKVGTTKVDSITKSSSTGKYTFGALTGTLDSAFTAYMTKYVAGDVKYVKYDNTSDPTAAARLADVYGDNYNMDIRAIDKDADGDIDMVILQTYAVIEVGSISHNTTTDKWTVNGTEYAKGLLTGADKLAVGDVVMVTPNVANQTLDLNALTPTSAGVLTRQSANTSYVIGGTTYKQAGAKVTSDIGTLTLGNEYVVYTDGVYALKVTTPSNKVTALPEICMLTAVGTVNTGFGTTYMVKVLKTDGTVTQYNYDDNDVAGAIVWDGSHANALQSSNAGTLYVYGMNKDGSIYFKALSNTAPNNTIPTSYTINTTAVGTGYSATKGLLGSFRMASDTKLFVVTADAKYKVMTLSQLTKNITANTLLVYTPDSTKIGTVMGGVVTLGTDSTESSTSAAYAIVTDVYPEWDAANEETVNKADVILADGTTTSMVYTGTAPNKGDIKKFTLTSGVASFADSELTAAARLTKIDGNYMTIGSTTQVAASNVVVVLNNGTSIKVSSLSAIDLTKTNSTQYVVATKTGEVTLLYVTYAG